MTDKANDSKFFAQRQGVLDKDDIRAMIAKLNTFAEKYPASEDVFAQSLHQTVALFCGELCQKIQGKFALNSADYMEYLFESFRLAYKPYRQEIDLYFRDSGLSPEEKEEQESTFTEQCPNSSYVEYLREQEVIDASGNIDVTQYSERRKDILLLFDQEVASTPGKEQEITEMELNIKNRLLAELYLQGLGAMEQRLNGKGASLS